MSSKKLNEEIWKKKNFVFKVYFLYLDDEKNLGAIFIHRRHSWVIIHTIHNHIQIYITHYVHTYYNDHINTLNIFFFCFSIYLNLVFCAFEELKKKKYDRRKLKVRFILRCVNITAIINEASLDIKLCLSKNFFFEFITRAGRKFLTPCAMGAQKLTHYEHKMCNYVQCTHMEQLYD